MCGAAVDFKQNNSPFYTLNRGGNAATIRSSEKAHKSQPATRAPRATPAGVRHGVRSRFQRTEVLRRLYVPDTCAVFVH